MSGATTQLSDKALAVLPAHVAIIMDGNGRWAKERSLPRVEGHRRGAESVRSVLRTAARLGVKYLTLYAFSVENWNRPQDEVDTLMKYLARYLKSEQREMNNNNVKLQSIGQTSRLPEFVRDQLEATRESLSQNTGTTLTLALSYGGRTELVDAVRGIAEKARDVVVAQRALVLLLEPRKNLSFALRPIEYRRLRIRIRLLDLAHLQRTGRPLVQKFLKLPVDGVDPVTDRFEPVLPGAHLK